MPIKRRIPIMNVSQRISLAALVALLAQSGMVLAKEIAQAVEVRYSATSGKEPSAIPELRFQNTAGGDANVDGSGNVLRTVDSAADSDGRYYFLPPSVAAAGSNDELEVSFVVSVTKSAGHDLATSLSLPVGISQPQFRYQTTGPYGEQYHHRVIDGHRVAVAFLSDGEHHDRDEVLLVDPQTPSPAGVLGRIKLPVNLLRRYTLSVRPANVAKGNGIVTLAVDAPGIEPLSIPLEKFARVNESQFGLLFGHPTGAGLAVAEWQEVVLRVVRSDSKPPSTEPAVLPIGSRRQLLVDDWCIEQSENLVREQGIPVKHPNNPVLRRDKPWEAARCELYGSVVQDEAHGRLQMFYSAMSKPYDTRLGYAESTDGGITWTKPELNVFAWEGKPTNIVYPARYWVHGPGVLLDPHDPDPAKRYKLWNTEVPVDLKLINGPIGIDALFSPDGIHWTPAANNPVIPGFTSDTGTTVFWDTKRNAYRAYPRLRADGKRAAGVMESADFVNWSKPKITAAPLPEDLARNWEFYGLSVTPYEDIYIGMLWIYPPSPEPGDSPVTWPELVVSRDGENWSRLFHGKPFLPLGPTGSFDRRQIRTATSMNIMSDRVLLFYSGSPDPHVQSHKFDIGMATLRLDGFASLRAAETEGTLLTRPLGFAAGKLYVNVDAAPDGYLKAELLDEHGHVVPGFAAEDCKPIQGDHLHAAITWNGHDSVPAAPPSGSRLRFILKNAGLYSFQAER
jgi:hypothetical protein